MYQLTVPLPPTVNHAYGTSGHRRYLKPAGVAFREEVAWIVKSGRYQKLDGRIAIVMRVYPRDKRVIDVDNRAKALLDALMHAGMFDDDSQVDDLHIIRGSIYPGGKCEVMIGSIQ